MQAAQGTDSVSHEELDDMLNNPLTALYNQQHPEVIAASKERQYE